MIISHTHSFIFFANPKTGSESIRVLLAPFQEVKPVPHHKQLGLRTFYPHIRPCEAAELFREQGWPFEKYFKFVCIRNPWSKLVSLFEMVVRNTYSPGVPSGIRATAGSTSPTAVNQFRLWTTQILSPEFGGRPLPKWELHGVLRFSEFVADRDGNELVDEIVKTEDLISLIPKLRRHGIPVPSNASTPKINAHPHLPYTSYYDPELAEQVGKHYKAEVTRFGYKFGDRDCGIQEQQ